MSSQHRPSPDVLVAHLAGEAVLLDLNTKRYFRLNATGASIWRALEEGKSRSEIVDALVAEYDVTERVAGEAVDESLAELEERGLVAKVQAE